MAFNPRNLSVLAYGNGFTLWHYKAGPDAQAVVRDRGYLDTAADLLTDGDMLMVSASDGGGIASVTVAADRVQLVALC